MNAQDKDFIDDGRGYIEVYGCEENLLGYIKVIDYGSLSYAITDGLDCAKKYMQEDLLFHDIVWLQGYCCVDMVCFAPVMPYSNI